MWCLLWLCILIPALSSTEQNCSQSWLHLSDDGYCMCGPDVYNAVLCNNETRQVRLQLQYCMTSDGEGSNISVIGNCMPSLVHRYGKITGPDGYYYKILQNRFAQQEKTCSYTNRQGRLWLCMESFQGYYRDRTDGGWDCRYFSTAYPTIRVIFYVASGTVHTFNMFVICNVLCIITAGIILIVRPYKPKYRVYHTFDALMMLALAVFAIGTVHISREMH